MPSPGIRGTRRKKRDGQRGIFHRCANRGQEITRRNGHTEEQKGNEPKALEVVFDKKPQAFESSCGNWTQMREGVLLSSDEILEETLLSQEMVFEVFTEAKLDRDGDLDARADYQEIVHATPYDQRKEKSSGY